MVKSIFFNSDNEKKCFACDGSGDTGHFIGEDGFCTICNGTGHISKTMAELRAERRITELEAEVEALKRSNRGGRMTRVAYLRATNGWPEHFFIPDPDFSGTPRQYVEPGFCHPLPPLPRRKPHSMTLSERLESPDERDWPDDDEYYYGSDDKPHWVDPVLDREEYPSFPQADVSDLLGYE